MKNNQNDLKDQNNSTGQKQNEGSQQNQGIGGENSSRKEQDEISQSDESDVSVEVPDEIPPAKKERSRTTPYAGNSNEFNQDE